MNSVNMARYRKGLIASAHIAADELGMSEGDYRALLKAQTGHDSAGKCSIPQLRRLIAYYKNDLGWQPRSRHKKPAPKTDDLRPLRDKIEALLADMRLPWEYADNILGRMFGVSVAGADRRQLTACIAALTRRQGKTVSA